MNPYTTTGKHIMYLINTLQNMMYQYTTKHMMYQNCHHKEPGHQQAWYPSFQNILLPINDKSTLAQEMPWCCQTTSQYLSQCWAKSMSSQNITRLQWVKLLPHVIPRTIFPPSLPPSSHYANLISNLHHAHLMMQHFYNYIYIYQGSQYSLQNKCCTADPDRQNWYRSGRLSFFTI